MKRIDFVGPFKLEGEPSVFDNIGQMNGIYLWTVKGDDNVFRVYYVGETQDVKARMYKHRANHLKGVYAGHCIDSLKSNVKILMHRAGEGMIPRFSHLDSSDFNKRFVESIYVFCAEIEVFEDSKLDKWHRCRFETAVSHQIENSGPNILSVGHLRYWKELKSKVLVDTGDSNIEYLTAQILEY